MGGRLRRPCVSGRAVEAIAWRGLPALLPSDQIGAYDHAPLTGQPTSLYTQIQRRNGVSDIAGLGRNYMVEGGMTLPPQRTQQPATLFTQAQRQGQTANQPQLSRYGVSQMLGNVRAAAVAQSGAGLIPFVNAMGGGSGG